MEITATNLIKNGLTTNYLKSEFKIVDSQKEYKIKPEETLKEIEALKIEIKEIQDTKVPKEIEKLKQAAIKFKERELFYKNRNLVRLNLKYPDAKWQ